MVQRIGGWVAGLAITVLAAACGDQSSSSYAYGGSSSGSGYSATCAQYTTCGSCTPVVGCGWCFRASGGQCASSPDECAFASSAEFTWTWDPGGCPGVDASVVPAPVGHAGGPDASTTASEASAPDAHDGAATSTADSAALSPNDGGAAADAAEDL
jgi:hypothetical protein